MNRVEEAQTKLATATDLARLQQEVHETREAIENRNIRKADAQRQWLAPIFTSVVSGVTVALVLWYLGIGHTAATAAGLGR